MLKDNKTKILNAFFILMWWLSSIITFRYSNCILFIISFVLQDYMTGLSGATPIYCDSTITRGEVLLMTLSFAFRHRLSRYGLEHLLLILNTIIPDCIPKSLYFMDKIFAQTDCLQCHINYIATLV